MNKNILLALWHANSRAVAFGLMLFAVSCVFLCKQVINSEQWMLCMASSSALVGGKSALDAFKPKKDEPKA